MKNIEHRAAAYSRLAWAKFVLCNLVGIFVFFVTVPFHGTHTIPLDVFCQLAAALVGPAQRWLVLGVCVAGALLPFAKKKNGAIPPTICPIPVAIAAPATPHSNTAINK